MKIEIKSNVSIGESLTKYIKNKITNEISKYLKTSINSYIFVYKNVGKFKVKITIDEVTKKEIIINSIAESNDAYNAFNIALSKIIKQLIKNKDKIKKYRKKITKAKNSNLPYILVNKSKIEKKDEILNENIFNFNVIEEKDIETEELNISDALMKMELTDLPAYVFVNKESKKINVVYKSNDNNIIWVNP